MNVDQGDQVGFRCFLIPVETCRKVTSHLKGGDLFPNGEAMVPLRDHWVQG